MKSKHYLPGMAAFTSVELMIVVTIICLLAISAVANFILARDTSRLNVIKRSLRETDVAGKQWAMENHKPSAAPVVDISEPNESFRAGNIPKVTHKTSKPILVAR